MASTKKPAARDFASEMGGINSASSNNAQSQLEAQQAAYAAMLQQQLGAVDTIAGRLNNSYTANANTQTGNAAGAYANMGQYGARLGALGGIAEADVNGTAIEEELRRQAMNDLQLGRSLSPEEERLAQQSGRAGYAARGMAVGQGSALAEVLNRDSLATSRESQRRSFAGDVNQTLTSNRLQRLGTAGNLLGQSAGVYANQGAGQLGVASQYLANDPYQRALGSSIPGNTMGASANMVSNAFGQTMSYGQDLYNTNYNAQWSDYLNNQNNTLATQMGQMQANSAKQAGNNALLGAGIGAAGAVVGAGVMVF